MKSEDKQYDPHLIPGSHIFPTSCAERRTLGLSAAPATASPPGDLNDSDKRRAPPTFAVSIGPSEDRALLDDSVGLEEAVHVFFCLLFVQHPHEQLPVF